MRLRPHTYTQPKPLMPVAGKPIIRFIVDKLVEVGLTDLVFIIGYLGDKIRRYLEQTYPHLEMEFVYQEQREGSAHAIWMAREILEDEDAVFIAFGDTIFEANLRTMLECPSSCLAIKKVNDPREFGVAEFDEFDFVTKLVEKPRIPKSNMAIVGLYKINEVLELMKAVEYLLAHDLRTYGEFQLTDALQIMVEQGIRMKTLPVDNWFDCGRKDVLLETNAMLLNQRNYHPDEHPLPVAPNSIFIPPVAVGDNCDISNSIIGPHVTIGDNVTIRQSIVQDSIIGNFASLDEVVLKHSVIGSDASVRGMNLSLNIGDNTEINFD